MIVDDEVLPAAVHLTGPSASSILGPAVAATGRELAWCRPSQVQYRPGSDLVVRFRAGVRTPRGLTVETLLAATTSAGPHTGTVPVEAEVPGGPPLRVGVWRWPYDPVLTALDQVVLPDRARDLFGDLAGDRPALSVVAYRPTERAVVRVVPNDRPPFFVKLVAPDVTGALVDRHHRLRRAGLPVPQVLAAGPGWLAMEAVSGPTLRERLKGGAGPWPGPEAFGRLLGQLATVGGDGLPTARSRVTDAPAHAAMLATVVPGERPRLERLTERFRDARLTRDPRPLGVVHGDLHEAQVVVDGVAIVGLLDVDDVGLGDPLDDLATLVGHLVLRGTTAARGDRIVAYARSLAAALTDEARDLDVAVAATLAGLATGPFRIQQPNWAQAISRQLDLVDRMLDTGCATTLSADEEDLRPTSRRSHHAPSR